MFTLLPWNKAKTWPWRGGKDKQYFFCKIFLALFTFEIGCYVAQAGPEVDREPKMTLNFLIFLFIFICSVLLLYFYFYLR